MSDPKALAARAAARDSALQIGIDEAFLSELVDAFYARVRSHTLLGPIFDAAIGDSWSTHLPIMKRFWRSIILHSGDYHGRLVPAHSALIGVQPWHFSIWLGLWRQTLEDIAPTEQAEKLLIGRAEAIAKSLAKAAFDFDLDVTSVRSAADNFHSEHERTVS